MNNSIATNPLKPRGFHFYEDGEKHLVKGVTYGPFCPDEDGWPYPSQEVLRRDMAAIAKLGANTIRLYEMAPRRVIDMAAQHGLRILIDVPWPKHLDVYEDASLRQMCIDMVVERLESMRNWPNLLGVMLGNEIPADLARWAGRRRIERFLRQLYDKARSIHPDCLVGFANYPSTEYLDLNFFDFIGFNIYLHDIEDFRRYLARLRLLYPEKPLLLSEIGQDTQRHSEDSQAKMLNGHLAVAYECGIAGAFVFSWTDEWHTGGFDIDDWSFGLVDEARNPKAALRRVRDVFSEAPACERAEVPARVSVVVASCNGGRTLRDCLVSLQAIEYPDYEIIVVDDGSTDNTAEILEEFPGIRAIRQENMGLSAARNSGVHAATGEIVAFTDSDCEADPHWLHHMVAAMQRDGFTGIGGPNLTPEESRFTARGIALAPGHATHVLINEFEAEHVPGCNMAFYRDALLAIGGFNPLFRKAGDDVDVIWRLQDAGHRIGFTTGGFVWHHRRPTLKGYIKQQRGYGEAETLLLSRHPHRFNDRGQSLWHGVIYSSQEVNHLVKEPNIHYGVFGSAGFQCLYEVPGGIVSYLITSLEWWILTAALLLAGTASGLALKLGLLAMIVSLSASGLRAWRRWNQAAHFPPSYFWYAWLLWVIQPVIRSASRHYYHWRLPTSTRETWGRVEAACKPEAPTAHRTRIWRFWAEDGADRLDLLRELRERMMQKELIFRPNNGWERWDFDISLSYWFKAMVYSAEENHGQSKRMLKYRLKMFPTSLLVLFLSICAVCFMAVVVQDHVMARVFLIVIFFVIWWMFRNAMHNLDILHRFINTEVARHGYLLLDDNGKPTTAETCKHGEDSDLKSEIQANQSANPNY